MRLLPAAVASLNGHVLMTSGNEAPPSGNSNVKEYNRRKEDIFSVLAQHELQIKRIIISNFYTSIK